MKKSRSRSLPAEPVFISRHCCMILILQSRTKIQLLRNHYAQLAEEHGNAYLHEMLRQVDPVSAEMIHANNVKRTIRALEYFEKTGEPISRHNEEERAERISI